MIVQFKSDCGVWFRRVKLKRQRVSAVFSLQKDFQSKFVRSFVRSTLAESLLENRFCTVTFADAACIPRGRGVAEIKIVVVALFVAQLVKGRRRWRSATPTTEGAPNVSTNHTA